MTTSELKKTWTKEENWRMTIDSFSLAFHSLPFLLKKILPFLILLFILDVSHFKWLPSDKKLGLIGQAGEIFINLAAVAFSLLDWVLLFFLVPFSLYNLNFPSKPLQFKPFIKRCIGPVIINYLKVFGITLFYLGAGALTLLLTFTPKLINLDYLHPIIKIIVMVIGGIFSIVFILLAIIRGAQFVFIPMVIFFNKNYREKKVNPLKLSAQICRGLPVIFFIYIVVSVSFKTSFVILDALFEIISVTFTSAFTYFIYSKKDRENMI